MKKYFNECNYTIFSNSLSQSSVFASHLVNASTRTVRVRVSVKVSIKDRLGLGLGSGLGLVLAIAIMQCGTKTQETRLLSFIDKALPECMLFCSVISLCCCQYLTASQGVKVTVFE